MSKFDDLDDYEEFDYIEDLSENEIEEEDEEKGDKLAVALRFDPEKDTAPRIVAAGKGDVARQIIVVAEQSDIPVYQDGSLAESLSQFEVGAVIPSGLYELVAEMLIFLYQLNESWLQERVSDYEYEE